MFVSVRRQKGTQCTFEEKKKKKRTDLGLGNAKGFKELGMANGQFNDFFDLSDLLVKTAHHVVG